MTTKIYSNPCWIISGTEENFHYAIKSKMTWGVNDRWFSQWKALEKEDTLFFYLSGKTKKIIGAGSVGNKFVQREPLWPDEIKEDKVKYPLRFEFSFYH